ncbi:cytochrome c [Wohlfahrtiimonas chitiniclastica]|uniref:c-type cytochrome n=1 Tax=Wohlfahrtiimonas chitiniclastica TaxID=400946 RepID=UPI0007B3FD97|nr:cytochrome c [Wohlfahrtiimonas chitiniclastica]KZS22844.1 Nicotinate dehydrogenase subunit B [Wohlfahrtiimonas chitiniclastica]MBS7828002.1 c-type cytochrome [Wohlfahrtiimonas chitiniclastica]WHR55290.1 cytochrome c [Wohlfahrtiimonas chitiniclastica]
MKKSRIWRILGMLVIVAIAVVVILTWVERLRPSHPPQVAQFTTEQINQGRYLAAVGDCASCHTTTNGALLAGGYQMATPFGTLYSSNITPSADFGIGRWTADEFYRSMTEGVSPIYHNIYPAMPYAYFTNITRQDSDALYAYLMSIPAIDVAPPQNGLNFPFNLRAMLIGWNILFLDKTPLPSASKGDSPEWQRGKYIVDTLGHCAMCHTPMGPFGEIKRDQMFKGGIMGSFAAPDITPEGLANRGWTFKDLQQYLSTGLAPQGSAFSDMYLVIHNSTQYFTDQDITAVATYLMGDQPLAPKTITEGNGNAAGRDTYLTLCSGCHSSDGLGKPNVAVAMVGNSTVRNADAHNLITAILEGLPWQTFPNDERLQAMPAFAKDLSDEAIANLVNFLRVQWGGLPADVTPDMVKALR